MSIPFTQYMLPSGRQVPVSIERPEDIEAKASQIIANGFCFECEMRSDMKTTSLSITDPNEGDLEIEVVPNGPGVPIAIDRMIERFSARLSRRKVRP